jgi:hypothetical protein
MTDIRNETQLVGVLEMVLAEVLEQTADEVLEIFKRDYLMKYVYESHMPNVIYHENSRKPTYEFLNAWDWTGIRKTIKTLSKELFYNAGKLSFNEETFLHGSIYSTPEDVRASLMDILNKKGRSSSLWLSSTAIRPVAYWDKFIDDFIVGGQLDKILTKYFAINGIRKS